MVVEASDRNSLSTTEAEYIALSMGMRELISIRGLIQELAVSFRLSRDRFPKSVAFGKNVQQWGTFVGQMRQRFPGMTPRSKHIAVKYHWFREHLVAGQIEVHRVDTKEQKADIYTKGLARKEFEAKRALLMGW